MPDFEWDSLVGLLLRVFFDNFLRALRFPYPGHGDGCPETLFLGGCVSSRPTMRSRSICVGGVVVCSAFAVRTAGPGTQVEDAADQTPTVGDVGDADGGAGLADVPEEPFGAEGIFKAVDFAESGA